MKTRSSMIFLGTIGLTFALGLGSGIQGCRPDMGGFGGSATGATTSGTGGMSAGGVVTIRQITDMGATGHVGPKTPVTVMGAVAMSPKFLVSHSTQSNTCLWGVFLSDYGLSETMGYTGILAVSYGTLASAVDGGKPYCPDILPHSLSAGAPIGPGDPAGDAFPDDTQPGDVLDVIGTTDVYIPTTCTTSDAGPGASMIPGIQLSKVTKVTRHGTTTPPKPHVFPGNGPDIVSLAAGNDPAWLAQWGNVRVEFDNVTVASQGGMLTDKYGHMLLQITGQYGIQVGDKLYYDGLAKYTDDCHAGPTYPTVPPFPLTSVTGFVYLDFCNWSLAPSSKCSDLNPPSIDCQSYADAGPDADPSVYCTH
jgi:hypothetical protein